MLGDRPDWIEQALRGAGIGVWSYDTRTMDLIYRGRISSDGQPYEAFERHTLEGLIAVIHPDDLSALRSAWEKCEEGRDGHREVEFRIRASSGQWHWMQATGDVVERDSAGMPARIAGVVWDCTARKRAQEELGAVERQLRQVRKMESMGTLAGGMAHDFNNILLAISGNAELVASAGASLSPEMADAVQQIRDAAERGADLTRRLLTFTKKHNGTQRRVCAGELVNGVLPMLRRLVPASISLEFVSDTGAAVMVDVGQIEQVVVNLVTNARDAISPRHGRISVTCDSVTVSDAQARAYPWVREGEFARIAVTDTGAGVAPEIADKIFDPFFTTKPVGEGTGLGLAMAYAIVQQHGGFLRVSSEPGRGARFEILLPRVPEPSSAPRVRRQQSQPPGGTEVILFAEDEPAVRKMTVRLLTKAGYEVVQASNGDEAVAFFRQAPDRFHLLLLDVVMPGRTGAEVFREVRSSRPALPVLFTTGYSAGAVGREILAEPRVQQITKPYAGSALMKQIRELLRSS